MFYMNSSLIKRLLFIFLVGHIYFYQASCQDKRTEVIYKIIENLEQGTGGTLREQIEKTPEKAIISEFSHFLIRCDTVLSDNRVKTLFNDLGIQEEAAMAYALLWVYCKMSRLN
jgi:hypothetical protein